MTFDEAFDCLNSMRLAEVAKEMAGWHPAILGVMLLAVQLAKEFRYPPSHPDYWKALVICMEREPRAEPEAPRLHYTKQLLKIQTKRLNKWMEQVRLERAMAEFERANDSVEEADDA